MLFSHLERCIGCKKPRIYVRKEDKDYGRQKTVEGVIKPGWNVVVIDDVIATGGSTTAAINAIRSEGGEVEDTIVLMTDPRVPERISERSASRFTR